MTYLDTENGTLKNAAHWAFDPLDPDTVAVLRAVQRGAQSFWQDRLLVAYLVARDCITADLENYTLAITEKGTDALAFYGTKDKDT